MFRDVRYRGVAGRLAEKGEIVSGLRRSWQQHQAEAGSFGKRTKVACQQANAPLNTSL
jgi:hypothetical protein